MRIGVQPSAKQWPPLETDDRDTVTFVITSAPDKLGRTHFWIKWFDDMRAKYNRDKGDPRPEGWQRGWRAQHYFADHTLQERYWRHTTLLKVAVVFEVEA